MNNMCPTIISGDLRPLRRESDIPHCARSRTVSLFASRIAVGGIVMDWKKKKTPLMGFVGGLGVVALLGGFIGGLYGGGFAMFLALAIWIIGATLVNVLID